jgi:uncharacterized membrane protein
MTTQSISFTGLLFITFLVLKLTEVINWSWWWVTAPLWGPIALVIIFAAVAIIFATILLVFFGKAVRWKFLDDKLEEK